MMTETYENIRPDKGFRFIAEKVSHNPLIIAVSIHKQYPVVKWTYQSELTILAGTRRGKELQILAMYKD